MGQNHYNKQTIAERVNSKLKEFAKRDNLKIRELSKIRLHGLLAMLVIQAKAIADFSGSASTSSSGGNCK